jgi:hypothetical protein
VLQYLLLKKGVQAGFISFSTVADGWHESVIIVFHESIDGWEGGRNASSQTPKKCRIEWDLGIGAWTI